MAFKRVTVPDVIAGDELTEAMIGIGMLFNSGRGQPAAHLDDTVLAASQEGMDRRDIRVLSVLTTWLELHGSRLNVDRLFRSLSGATARVKLYWAAIAHWKRADPRWGRVRRLCRGPRVDLSQSTAFHVRRSGEDPRFVGGPLRASLGALRDRKSDVLTPTELTAQHRGYYWRVVIGPSYRADMWARLEAEPTLSAAELARSCYGSYATAWHVRRDFALVR